MEEEKTRSAGGSEAAFLTGTIAATLLAGAAGVEAQDRGEESADDKKWRRKVEKTERKVSRLLDKTLEKMAELDELYQGPGGTAGGWRCE